MEFGLGVIVGVVVAYFLVKGVPNEELKRLRQTVKQYGEQLAGWRQKYYTLQQQLAETRRQMEVKSGDYEARQQRLLGSIGTAAAGIDQILSLLPQVEDVRSYLGRQDAQDIGKLDLPFAHEFQVHMTQAYADNLESMGNLYHGLLNLSLGLRYLKATGASVNPGVRFVGDVLENLKATLIEYAPKLDVPGIKEEFAEAFAIKLRGVTLAARNGEEAADPELKAKILQAMEEATKKLPEQRRAPVAGGVVMVPGTEAARSNGARSNGHSPKVALDAAGSEDGHV